MNPRWLIPLVAVAVSVLGGSCSRSPVPVTPLGDQKLTVVVVVVDSLMPSDIGLQTPTLESLIAAGTYYPESRAVFSAETIPNHVAMMTGLYPDRNGIPTNNFIDFAAPDGPEERDLSLPEELTANTLFTWINRRCRETGVNRKLRHGATLSKKYLFEIFEGDAADRERSNRNPAVFNVRPDSYWDPQTSPAYIGPGSEHTPDVPTMDQALSQLPDVDFLFINLGDVDRSAHAGGEAFRAAVLADTDQQLDRLVSELQGSGRWDNTVLIVLSDHGMDFTLPGPAEAIVTQPTLDELGACFAPMQAVQNGGTNSIYVMDRDLPLPERQAAVRAARACLLGTQDCDALCEGASRPANATGIAHAWYTRPDLFDPGGTMPASIRSQHPNLGDLVLVADAGYKFSEPDESGNALPGNHGHVATVPNFMLVTGGSPWVRKGVVVEPSKADPTPFDRLPEQAENVDVTPTVAWLLGLKPFPHEFPDEQDFDGRILTEAFVQFETRNVAPPPTVCGRFD